MSDLIRREDVVEALNDCIDIKGLCYRQLHDAIMDIPAVDEEPALTGEIENSQHV